MEKNTKILLGIAAAGVAAYLIFKPKALASTKRIDINSLKRIQASDDTPEGIVGGYRRSYRDSNGVIYKLVSTTSYPPNTTYTDQNGNQYDGDGNYIGKVAPLNFEIDGNLHPSDPLPDILIQSSSPTADCPDCGTNAGSVILKSGFSYPDKEIYFNSPFKH